MQDKWLTSLVINKFLEISNKDIDKPVEIQENEITQMTSKDYEGLYEDD